MLEPVSSKWKTAKDPKNAIMEEMAGKQPHEAFEKYFNAELKEMIVTETSAMLLKRTQIKEYFLEKGEDIGLLTVYESISRKEFEDIKWYIRFADNNHLNT